MSYMSLREEDSFQVQKSKKHGNRKYRRQSTADSQPEKAHSDPKSIIPPGKSAISVHPISKTLRLFSLIVGNRFGCVEFRLFVLIFSTAPAFRKQQKMFNIQTSTRPNNVLERTKIKSYETYFMIS